MHVVYPLGPGRAGGKCGGQGSRPGPERSVCRRLPPQLHANVSAPVQFPATTRQPDLQSVRTRRLYQGSRQGLSSGVVDNLRDQMGRA
ncbi:unnamed protein product, partial [Iphiclides podalirius]